MSMPVPSSYNDITPNMEVRDHVGLVWYDRQFFVPHSWQAQDFRVWLRFGSVNYFAQVVSVQMMFLIQLTPLMPQKEFI